MLKVFGGLKDFLKKEEVVKDGPIFRFHNVFTAIILFSCSLIVTASQLVGDPIQCIVDDSEKRLRKPINTYCWITSTFTIPRVAGEQVGLHVAHPGVGPDIGGNSSKTYYTYYQWVCFVLFFQGAACYFPKWLWDNYEGGLMKTLVTGLNHYMYTEKEKNIKKDTIVQYVLDHAKTHRMYAIRYWLCEFLCFVNILTQLYFMNEFFNGEFLQYGLDVLKLSDRSQDSRYDPMIYIFPRVTKCTFRKFGPSGGQVRLDALCVLPLNVVNEKTYIFIWFWFIFLAALLTLLMAYRICLIMFPALRPRLLKTTRKVASRRDARIVSDNLDVGDWWVLYMLGKNLDRIVYNEIVVDLAKKMEDPDGKLMKR